MTYLANPTHYNQAEFKLLVESLKWDKGWKPIFPVLHNTAVPSLATWKKWGPTPQQRWPRNLNSYYKSLGWHSGPHLVCCPDYIWNLCDLEHDGVSVSCWNHLAIGIEMVGDYEHEDFSSGDGARVRDNAIWALSVLSDELGWKPAPLVQGKTGLHFHKMCTRDHHPCPGKNVNYDDVVKRVTAQMAALFNPAEDAVS